MIGYALKSCVFYGTWFLFQRLKNISMTRSSILNNYLIKCFSVITDQWLFIWIIWKKINEKRWMVL